MPAPPDFFDLTQNGVRLFLRASPGASRNKIAGLWLKHDGERRLAVHVLAPPDKGKANAAILKLLAKSLGLPKSALSVTAGETSRLKTIAIAGEPKALAAALTDLSGENR